MIGLLKQAAALEASVEVVPGVSGREAAVQVSEARGTVDLDWVVEDLPSFGGPTRLLLPKASRNFGYGSASARSISSWERHVLAGPKEHRAIETDAAAPADQRRFGVLPKMGSNGSRIAASSLSGLFTRVESGHIIIGSGGRAPTGRVGPAQLSKAIGHRPPAARSPACGCGCRQPARLRWW